MESSKGQWQIRLRHGWADVGPEDEAFIESAWANKQLSFKYFARREAYEVDFQRMCQRDSRGRERALRRAPTASTSNDCDMVVDVEAELAAEIESAIRAQVREETCKRVLARVGLMVDNFKAVETQLSKATPDASLREDLSKVRYFRESGEVARSRREDPKSLLRRFEVLATPCSMEFGPDWLPLPSSSIANRFWIHHVAALNIGESSHAADFSAYVASTGDLNEDAYLSDMRRIFVNLFEAQVRIGAKHSVLVPIGMGAFLRYLARNDPAYAVPECISRLRRRIAQEFAQAARQFAILPEDQRLMLHVCVQGGIGEASQNRDALVDAFAEAGLGPSQVCICEDVDATVVAATLADQWWLQNRSSANSSGVAPVSLANAANARQLGNHWFGGGALRAIDENLHRRAPLLCAISLLLNASTSIRTRSVDELATRVVEFGGDVITLTAGVVSV